VNFASKIIKYTALRQLSFLFGIVSNIVLARLISPEYFAPFVTSLAVLEVIYAFGDIGLRRSIINNSEKKDIFGTALLLSICISLILLFTTVISAHLLVEEQLFWIVFILALSKSISFISRVYSSFLEKDFRHVLIASAELFAKFTSFFFALYLIYAGLNTFALVYREILYFGIIFIILFAVNYKDITYRFDFHTAKIFLSSSFYFSFSSIAMTIQRNLPVIFFGKFSDLDAAHYNRSFFIAGLSNSLMVPITDHISYSYYVREKKRKANLMKSLNLNLFFFFRILLPLSFILYIYSEDIVFLLFGQSWGDSADYIEGLSGFFLLWPMYNILRFFLYSQKEIGAVNKNIIFGLIFLSVFIFLVQIFNYNYSIISWGVSANMLLCSTHLLFYVNKVVSLDLKKILLRPSLSFVISLAALFQDLPDLINLSLFFFIYVVCLYFLERKEIKEFLDLIFKKS